MLNRLRFSNKWIILAIISLGTFSTTLEGGMLVTAYPVLTDAFNIQVATVLWVTVAFWVTSVGVMMTFGWLGDVAGRRQVYAWGLVIFALGLLFSGMAFSFWQLILFRVFQGIGCAMILANVNALITQTFPKKQRGLALGFSGAVVGLGLTIGPFLGGILLDVMDWRSIFYSRVPIAIAGALLSFYILPDDRPLKRKFDVDLIGAFALLVALSSSLLYINQGASLGFTSPIVIAMFLLTVGFSPIFIWAENRSSRPIIEIGLFRNKQYTLSILILISHYLAQGGVLLIAPFFMLESLEYSATKMGIIMAAFSASRPFLAPIAGRLSDNYGPRPLLIFGNVLLAIALFWISKMGLDINQGFIFSGMLLASMGSAFFEPVVTSSIMGSVPVDRLGTASAFVALGRQTAFAVGITLAGSIFTIRERSYLNFASEIEALSLGFSDVILSSVFFAVIAVIFSVLLTNTDGYIKSSRDIKHKSSTKPI